MGNRHGSMGVTINYDADLQASVETASVDKAMDIEADLKDKLQSKIKENEDVEATVTLHMSSEMKKQTRITLTSCSS